MCTLFAGHTFYLSLESWKKNFIVLHGMPGNWQALLGTVYWHWVVDGRHHAADTVWWAPVGTRHPWALTGTGG